MTDEQRQILDLALFDLSSDSGVRWSREYMAEVAAALRALLDENAALKKADPLAEMWRELSEYQPQADADGYGESWRRMCEDRTEEAAERAQEILEVWISAAAHEPWLAAMSARWAVAWRQRSMQNALQAIAAIRRAKEARL